MVFRTGGALAILLLGLAGPGAEAIAQYYPPSQPYPPPAYPPQGYPSQRVLPPPIDDDDDFFYDPPMVQRRSLPPPPMGGSLSSEPLPPPGVRPGRGIPPYPGEAELAPLPPGFIYRDGVVQPLERTARPGAPPPSAPPSYGTPPALPHATAPGVPGPQEEGVRPPMPIGPGQLDPGPTGAVRGDPRMAALPPEVRPETGPVKELPPQFRRTMVDYRSKEPPGTIVVDTQNTLLYFVLGNGKAMRYGIGVGREGFTWTGAEKVTKMAEWPDWNPPEEMIERQPYLPRFMAGGPGNPLGARALYLGKTIYRIHGTNQPSTIGSFVSSGCIRLTNEDVMDLYTRVRVGTRVVVLPGKPPPLPPPTALVPGAPPPAVAPGAPPVTMAPIGPPPTAVAR